jgi:hypothetical protein
MGEFYWKLREENIIYVVALELPNRRSLFVARVTLRQVVLFLRCSKIK